MLNQVNFCMFIIIAVVFFILLQFQSWSLSGSTPNFSLLLLPLVSHCLCIDYLLDKSLQLKTFQLQAPYFIEKERLRLDWTGDYKQDLVYLVLKHLYSYEHFAFNRLDIEQVNDVWCIASRDLMSSGCLRKIEFSTAFVTIDVSFPGWRRVPGVTRSSPGAWCRAGRWAARARTRCGRAPCAPRARTATSSCCATRAPCATYSWIRRSLVVKNKNKKYSLRFGG